MVLAQRYLQHYSVRRTEQPLILDLIGLQRQGGTRKGGGRGQSSLSLGSNSSEGFGQVLGAEGTKKSPGPGRDTMI